MPTDKQQNFARQLQTELGLPADGLRLDLSKQEASDAISAMIAMKNERKQSAPRREERTGVPAGRYAVDFEEPMATEVAQHDTVFVKVDRPTEGRWAGRVFVTQLSGENHRPIRGRLAKATVLRAVETAGAEAAMKRFGRELGVCGNCGKRLTDDASRAMGIGPDCFEKLFGHRRTADDRKAAIAGTNEGQEQMPYQDDETGEWFGPRPEDAEAHMQRLEMEGDRAGTALDEAGKAIAKHILESPNVQDTANLFARMAGRIGDAVAEGVELWKIVDGIRDEDAVLTDAEKGLLVAYAEAHEAKRQIGLRDEFGF